MSIVRIADYDIAPILEILPQFDEWWGEEGWRATMPYSPHRDSEMIYLRRQPGSRPRDILHQLASVVTRHHHGPLAQAIDEVCALTQGRPARAMLVRLAAGGRIYEHADIGIYADATERFHIPIVTNPGAWLMVNGEKYQLPSGGIFAFDKHSVHSGGNDGDSPRVHLIVDTMPESPNVLAG
jgi:quercetin dioxygenase-like cupin family protein